MRQLSACYRVTGYVRDGKYAGPDGNTMCPCGSYRLIRSCHRSKDGYWLASPADPLLLGPRTGLSNDGCYGRAANDCSPRLSREHWMSASVIEAIQIDGLPPKVSGLPWMKGATMTLPTNALASRILCERHNSALSPLDSLAETFFRATRDDQLSYSVPNDSNSTIDSFTLCPGPQLELWLLKLLWGSLASKSIRVDGQIATQLKAGIDLGVLADVLWRGTAWPDQWGLYSQQHSIDPHGSPNSVAMQSFTAPDGSVLACAVEFGALRLIVALGKLEGPTGTVLYRPGGIQFTTVSAASEKVIGLTWPDPGHPSVQYTRLADAPEG